MSTDPNPITPALGDPDCTKCQRNASGYCREHPKPKPEPDPEPTADGAGPGRPTSRSKLVKKVTETIEKPGNALVLLGTLQSRPTVVADGHVIIAGAPGLAEALVKVGEENPKVMAWLETLNKQSANGALFAAVLAIVFPIAVNHGLIPSFAPAPIPEPEQPAA